MIRTNSKQARQNVRDYIRAHYDGSNYDFPEPETWPELAAVIMETFRAEHWSRPEDYRYYKTEQRSFESWAAGLPSIIDTCYYYNRPAVDDLARILDETPDEASRYSEQDAERLLTYLIYSELVRGAAKAEKEARAK